MAGRLQHSLSPYLRAHADNPVDWWEWSPAAFEQARDRDVPVLISIGYAACHWCHVMAHQSFEDSQVAQLLNAQFVPIKVDREERPDVDAVYMAATVASTGHGGWPMTVLATPDGRPFWCGTYLPRDQFLQLLAAAGQAWQLRRSDLETVGQEFGQSIQQMMRPAPAGELSPELLTAAVRALRRSFDPVNAGFGRAPKFPPSMVLEFLLREHSRTGDPDALVMAGATLSAMARGGIYDQLAGGFARYSVDTAWVVPHFEKMLYDNAQLGRVYLHWYRTLSNAATGAADGSQRSATASDEASVAASHPAPGDTATDPLASPAANLAAPPSPPRHPDLELAERIARECCEFIATDLGTADGGFAAALDADTDGVEGLTYVWNPAELAAELGHDDGARAAALLQVTDEGTFEHGRSTLQLLADPDDPRWWADVRERLLTARARRPQPARDDKVVTSWNGLAIALLADAGALLGEPRYLRAAERAADLLLNRHLVDGHLRRASLAGEVSPAAGVADDYGNLAEGLLALYQATGQPRWLTAAGELLHTAIGLFGDGSGAFYDTAAADAPVPLIARPHSATDNAEPSGQSALAVALLSYAALTGAVDDFELAATALAVGAQIAGQDPRFAGWTLAGITALTTGPVQVAVVGTGPDADALLAAARRSGSPGLVIAHGAPDTVGVPLLVDRPLIHGRAAAYVCRGFICDLPTTDPLALTAQLNSHPDRIRDSS